MLFFYILAPSEALDIIQGFLEAIEDSNGLKKRNDKVHFQQKPVYPPRTTDISFKTSMGFIMVVPISINIFKDVSVSI